MMAGAPPSPRSGKGSDRKVVTEVESVPVTHHHATVDVSDRLHNPGGATAGPAVCATIGVRGSERRRQPAAALITVCRRCIERLKEATK